MNVQVDLAIVGSGFGGSLLALIARRLGLTVALLERERHPRFVIGESSTPLASLLLEELARRYDLPELLPFTKWGAWRRQRPDVRCGLKRGFTFYHHQAGEPWTQQDDRRNELLVAASPRDEIADTHWYRPDFDQALVRMAVAHGAELFEETRLESLGMDHPSATLSGRTAGKPLSVRARLVVDASGPRGFVARALGLPEVPVPALPRTQALYSHFEGVTRWSNLHPTTEESPYPADDAAQHHVFAGGWIWVLRFAHGVTSAGVAATDDLAAQLQLHEGAAGWARLMDHLPAVREQFRDARPCLDFRHTPRLTYRSSAAMGPGWALLPSAAGFVDPLLSTGFPLTLLGIERLARNLEADWDSPRWGERMSTYGAVTLSELDRTAELIGALYANLDDFETFAPLTQLYFAAASFSETARRLDRPELAPGFLSQLESLQAWRECLAMARTADPRQDRRGWAERIRRAIEPINVAGLANPARRNWYPARAEDLLAAAGKLNVDQAAIQDMLRRTGF